MKDPLKNRGQATRFYDETQLPPIEEREVPWLTVGDIRKRLEHMPDDMPLLGYATFHGYDEEDTPIYDGWVNLTDLHFDPTNPDIAVTIEVRDTYDTRQW